MKDIDKQVREIITRLFAYGVDWTELRDKSKDDHEVSTFAAKIKSDFANEVAAEIAKLISEQTTLARTEVYGEIKNMFLSEFYEMLKDVQTDMEKP